MNHADVEQSGLDSSQKHSTELAGPPAVPPPNVFKRQGDMRVLTFGNCTVYIKESLGTACLARLLAQPGQRFFAPDLLAEVKGEPLARQTSSGGAIIDKKTREDVEQCLRDLELAKQQHDEAAQLREQAALTEYLRKATGFARRTRKDYDDTDRRRRAVTQAIRRTIEKINEHLPEAGRHLDFSVNTGRSISYDPVTPMNWET